MSASSVKVRWFRPADRSRLLEIKCQVFAELSPRNEATRWEWEFERNPASSVRMPSALVLETTETIVGFFGIVPYRIKLGDRMGLAGNGIDLCILPEAQGQGMAHPLIAPLWQPGLCDFAFAVAVNPASRHLFAKHGATLFGGAADRAGFGFRPQVGNAAVENDRGLEPCTRYGPEEDELWQRVSAEHPLTLVRDAQYLNWRYADFPFAKAEGIRLRDGRQIRGLVISQYNERTGEMFLLELITPREDTEALDRLVLAVCARACRRQAKVLYAATRCEHQRLAFQRASFKLIPGELPSFMGKLLATDPKVALSQWTPALGDGDVLFNLGEPQSG